MVRLLPVRRDRYGAFTDPAREVVLLAHLEALGLGRNYVSTGHLLLGLAREGHGVAARALGSLGLSHARLRAGHATVTEIAARGSVPAAGSGACNPRSARELLWLTGRVKRVLFTHAPAEARRLGHNHIGTEHLLLGLLREDDATTADLTSLGAGPPQVRQAVLALLPGHRQLPAPAQDAAGLQAEVVRLRALLRDHGIEPDTAAAHTA